MGCKEWSGIIDGNQLFGELKQEDEARFFRLKNQIILHSFIIIAYQEEIPHLFMSVCLARKTLNRF